MEQVPVVPDRKTEVETASRLVSEGLRVAFVSHTGEMRGAERALLELVDGLGQKNVQCSVLLPRRGPLVAELTRRRVPLAILPYRWWIAGGALWKRPLREAMTAAALLPAVRQIKRWRADVVMTNTCTTPVGALAALVLHKPHVWFIHEFGQEDHGITFDFGIRCATRLIDRLSDAVLVNSQAVGDYYARYIPAERLRRVYQAVDLGPGVDRASVPVLARQAGPARLVQVARIEEGKGQLDSVLALGELIRRGMDAELTLVGGSVPGYLRQIKKAVADQGLERFVHFAGYVDNASAILGASHIALVCSRAEAFGRVAIEAMKIGTAVIGARSGATQELIQDRLNGLLYEPGDFQGLADRIELLLRNPELARNLAENGRRWAWQTFGVEQYAGQVLDILNEAAGRRLLGNEERTGSSGGAGGS